MFPSMKNRQFWNLLLSRLFMGGVFFFVLFFIVTSPQIVKSVVENQKVLADLRESFYRLRGLYHMTAEGEEGEGESELEDVRAQFREDLQTFLKRSFFASMREIDDSFAEIMEEAEKRIGSYLELNRGVPNWIDASEKQAPAIESTLMELEKLVEVYVENQLFSIRVQNIFLIVVIALFVVAVVYLDMKSRVEERRKEEMQSLSRRYIADFEVSSKSVALEIHDTVLQELAVVRRFHHVVRKKKDPKESEKEWEIIDSALEKSSKTLRNIIDDIQPWSTEHLSFEEVLKTSLRGFIHDESINIDVRVGALPEKALNEDEKHHILSIMKEALSNVQKHSGANEVGVKVVWEPPFLLAAVTDNGRGFKPDRYQKVSSNHIGLYSMRERASMAGGTLRITSNPGRGTEVLFRLKK